jgi:hypothetical protein
MTTQIEMTKSARSLTSVRRGRQGLRSIEVLNPALRNIGEPSAGESLHIDRNDIFFGTVRPGVVQIRLTVWNRGTQASRPTACAVEAAPLGAFLPWQSLTVLAVPAIAPGCVSEWPSLMTGSDIPKWSRIAGSEDSHQFIPDFERLKSVAA